MGIRKACLCLVLLTALFAADAMASNAGSALLSGELELVLSPDAFSALPIDVQALAEGSCGITVGAVEKIGPPGECRLKVVASGGATVKGRLHPGAPPAVDPELFYWEAAALDIASAEPVETSCGAWDVSLRLDATDLQPVSPLILSPAPGAPGRGTFASVLEMRARLHLANRATGQSVDHPLGLGLGLAGPWILEPLQSRLRLLDGWKEQCFPVWLVDYPEDLEQFLRGHCQFCLGAAPASGGTAGRLP